MTQVYIHIGLHKTATTFLQTLVFPRLKGTIYLSRPYTQLNHAFNKLQYADDARYNEMEIRQELEKFQNAERLFISDEMLSGIPNFNYINRSVIAKRISELFPDANIILFLRGQIDLINSLYNTWVKNQKGTRTIQDFVYFPTRDYSYRDFQKNELKAGSSFQRRIKTFYFHYDHFSLNLSNFFYYELVSFYKQLFKNVHVFLFEDFRQNPWQEISKLQEILANRREAPHCTVGQCGGVSRDDFVDINQQDIESSRNVSLGEVDLEGRRFRNGVSNFAQNKILLKIAELTGKLVARASSNPSNKDYLKQYIKEFYRENNQKLIQAYPEIALDKYPQNYQL
ncbi:hypothetical protein [Crocosphaera sp. Alani8]|uniref:hypothetical protein n=1 Tax=Crocosphaera sp. Alani8 TaxID=3038952 RepID=UPI00313B3E8A